MKRKSNGNRRSWTILAAAVAALHPLRASATTRQWQGGTSNWNTASNWNPSGVPGSGDAADVTSAAGATQTITYNYTGPAVSLSGLIIDLTGNPSVFNASEIFVMSANSLSVAGTEIVGDNESGSFNQSGGTNTISNSNSLYLGVFTGSLGVYTLSGSASLSVTGDEVLGDYGLANFNQSSGTNMIGANLFLGYISNSNEYTLSGSGSLSVTSDEYVGYSGSANVNQSGGTNTMGDSLFLGFAAGSTGAYTLSGGSLSVSGSEYVGNTGSGSFNQSGGMNTTFGNSSNLYLGNISGSTGAYTLSGSGYLAVAIGEYMGENGSGSFNQSGGTNQSGGLLELGTNTGSSGTYNLSGGALSINGDEVVGSNGSGNFNQSGGTNTIGNFLVIGDDADSTFILSGGSATVTSNVYIGGSSGGSAGAGVLNVSNTGELNVGGTLTIYNTPGSSLNLEGGTISTSVLDLSGAPSLFNWTGGVLQLTSSSGVIFDSSASALESSLSLTSGMTLLVAGNEFVGLNGTGAISQNGGTNGVGFGSSLLIGYGTGTGSYTLSGTGLLSTNDAEVVGGSGAGTFNQYGGTSIISNGLSIAVSPGSTGSYFLSGGILNTNNVHVGGSANGPGGAGVMTVSGGASLSASAGIAVYDTPGSALNVNGGSVSAPVLNLLGVYSQTDGTATFRQITGTGEVGITGGQTTLSVAGLPSEMNELSVSGPGTLDITNNSLTINYGLGNPTPVVAIESSLRSGYNGGAWNGVGIESSSVAALNSSQSALIYSIGYADGSDGITGVPSGEIEIMPTLAGDAKMQGNVVFGDFQLLSQYFGQTGTSWDEGNFSYGSSTNFGDFQLLSQNFGANASALTAGELASLAGFAAEFGDQIQPNPSGVGFSLVAVPEPTSAVPALFIMGGVLIPRRRRVFQRVRRVNLPSAEFGVS